MPLCYCGYIGECLCSLMMHAKAGKGRCSLVLPAAFLICCVGENIYIHTHREKTVIYIHLYVNVLVYMGFISHFVCVHIYVCIYMHISSYISIQEYTEGEICINVYIHTHGIWDEENMANVK